MDFMDAPMDSNIEEHGNSSEHNGKIQSDTGRSDDLNTIISENIALKHSVKMKSNEILTLNKKVEDLEDCLKIARERVSQLQTVHFNIFGETMDFKQTCIKSEYDDEFTMATSPSQEFDDQKNKLTCMSNADEHYAAPSVIEETTVGTNCHRPSFTEHLGDSSAEDAGTGGINEAHVCKVCNKTYAAKVNLAFCLEWHKSECDGQATMAISPPQCDIPEKLISVSDKNGHDKMGGLLEEIIPGSSVHGDQNTKLNSDSLTADAIAHSMEEGGCSVDGAGLDHESSNEGDSFQLWNTNSCDSTRLANITEKEATKKSSDDKKSRPSSVNGDNGDKQSETTNLTTTHIREITQEQTSNKYEDEFIKYAEEQNNKYTYICSFCDKKFCSKRSLTTHITRVHKREKVFKCLVCGEKFLYSACLRRHMQSHPDATPHHCKICNQKYPTYRGLQTHDRQIHRHKTKNDHKNDKDIVRDCEISKQINKSNHEGTGCSQQNDNDSSNINGMELSKVMHFCCPVCGASFVRRCDCKKHMETTACSCSYTNHVLKTCLTCSGELEYDYCKRCQHIYVSFNLIRYDERKKSCRVCGLAVTVIDLAKHMQRHIGKQKFRCSKSSCGKVFFFSYECLRHVRRHQSVVSRPESCFTCGGLLNNLECTTCQVLYVEKLEKGIKPQPTKIQKSDLCTLCGKMFQSNAYLKIHMLRHENIWPFSCSQCSKKCRTKGDLKLHMLVHTGEKRYECSYCHARFGTGGQLVGHTRLHTGEKPFKCDICGKTFRMPGSLKNHRTVHTGERPYECTLCDSKFKRSTHLKNHYKFRHKS